MPKRYVVIGLWMTLLISLAANIILYRKRYRLPTAQKVEIEKQFTRKSYDHLIRLMNFSLENHHFPVENPQVFFGNDSITKYRLSDLVEDGALIFSFSHDMCEICVDFAIEKLKEHFKDYPSISKVILLPISLQSRLKEGFYGKQTVSYVKGEPLVFEDVLKHPCFFILDGDLITDMVFIPEKSFPEMTDMYLEKVKSRLNYQMP